jgi:signal transduction histidine kinase
MRSKGSRELEIIEQEVDRLRTLVRRAGEIVKDSRGKPVRVDIVLFLHELVIPFGKDVSVIPPRGGAPYLCGIDPDRLRSILENVIRNALEAGGAPVELAISREKRSVRVDIRDSGPGIPPEHRRRVFDPLFTTKSNGWGVGLNIARQFAEAAGGHLTLTCPSGGGTIITLTMPEAAP